MKKLSFILCILAVTIWSCSKKSDPPSTASTTNGTTTSGTTTTSTTSTGTNCELATITKAGGYLETFVYNGSDMIIERKVRQSTSSIPYEDTMGYNSNGSLYYIKLNGPGNYRILYYAKNKTLKEVDEWDISHPSGPKYVYYYDSLSGTKPKTVYYTDATLPYDHTDITYDGNGNVIQTTEKNTSLKIMSYEKYEYDTKVNNMSLQLRFVYSALAFATWGPNNCTKITSYDQFNSVTETDNYKYTYDANGHPLSSAFSSSVGISETDSFTYHCK